jgi:hypothetical protein
LVSVSVKQRLQSEVSINRRKVELYSHSQVVN